MTALQPSQAIRNADGLAPPIVTEPTVIDSEPRFAITPLLSQTTRVVSGVPARCPGNVTEAGVKIAVGGGDAIPGSGRVVGLGPNAASVGALRVAAQLPASVGWMVIVMMQRAAAATV